MTALLHGSGGGFTDDNMIQQGNFVVAQFIEKMPRGVDVVLRGVGIGEMVMSHDQFGGTKLQCSS